MNLMKLDRRRKDADARCSWYCCQDYAPPEGEGEEDQGRRRRRGTRRRECFASHSSLHYRQSIYLSIYLSIHLSIYIYIYLRSLTPSLFLCSCSRSFDPLRQSPSSTNHQPAPRRLPQRARKGGCGECQGCAGTGHRRRGAGASAKRGLHSS